MRIAAHSHAGRRQVGQVTPEGGRVTPFVGSRDITLYPGDIIVTGTSAGISMGFDPRRWLKHGDVVRNEIDDPGVSQSRFVGEAA